MSADASSGLLIAGCETACGKTVLLTGLAATLREEGFSVRALKPLCLGSRRQAEPELAFISSISQTPLTYPVRFLDGGEPLNTFQWNETVRVARSGTGTVLVELPGACSTPIRHDGADGRWLDTGDLARALNMPCLLVAREGPDAMERLILNATYLIAASMVNVIGLVTVETTEASRNVPADERCHGPAGMISSEMRAIALQERTAVPYLGCLKYSPSISVERVNQGNLIKTTSAGLDLLPIIKTLNFRLSV